jgi:hypothetical protein
MFKWIKDKWAKFEAWVAGWAPGVKVKLISALGFIGATAGYLQEFISGVPLDKFITGTQIAIISAVLFTLTFWLRGIGQRVADRNA